MRGIIVILGRRGYGKSTKIRDYLKRIKQRYIIFDTLAEFSDCGMVVYTRAELINVIEKRKDTYFQVVFQPIDEEIDSAFDTFLRVCWIVGSVTCVVDEVDQVSGPTSIPHQLNKSINFGRHRDISFIAASRRAHAVPRILTSQADIIVLFNQREPRDVAYIKDFVGEEIAIRVQSLERYYYITVYENGEFDEPATLHSGVNEREEDEEETEETENTIPVYEENQESSFLPEGTETGDGF